jgi:hypothetical protein
MRPAIFGELRLTNGGFSAIIIVFHYGHIPIEVNYSICHVPVSYVMGSLLLCG